MCGKFGEEKKPLGFQVLVLRVSEVLDPLGLAGYIHDIRSTTKMLSVTKK